MRTWIVRTLIIVMTAITVIGALVAAGGKEVQSITGTTGTTVLAQ